MLYLTNGISFPNEMPSIFDVSNIVVDAYLLNLDEEKGSNLKKFATKTGGRMKIIGSTTDLASKIGNYFGETSSGIVERSDEALVFSPTWDPVSGWTVFSLTKG